MEIEARFTYVVFFMYPFIRVDYLEYDFVQLKQLLHKFCACFDFWIILKIEYIHDQKFD